MFSPRQKSGFVMARLKLSLCLIVIVPIIQFDKFVDAMDLNEINSFAFFMNINENDENQDLFYCHLKGLNVL